MSQFQDNKITLKTDGAITPPSLGKETIFINSSRNIQTINNTGDTRIVVTTSPSLSGNGSGQLLYINSSGLAQASSVLVSDISAVGNVNSSIASISANYTPLTTTANISSSLQSQATTNASNIVSLSGNVSALQSQVISLSARPIPDIFRAEVAIISGGLQSQATTNSSNISVLQSQVVSLSARPIPDIFRSEVQTVSSSLQTQITSISGTYTSLITTASISGNLQSQINAIVQEGTTITSSGGTILVTNIGPAYRIDVSDYISKTQVSNLTGSLQSQITTNTNNISAISGAGYITSSSLLPYTLLTTSSDISAYLQSQATTNSSNIAAISGNISILQSQVISLSARPIPDIFRAEVASISASIISTIPTSSYLDNRYVFKSGDTMTGSLSVYSSGGGIQTTGPIVAMSGSAQPIILSYDPVLGTKIMGASNAMSGGSPLGPTIIGHNNIAYATTGGTTPQLIIGNNNNTNNGSQANIVVVGINNVLSGSTASNAVIIGNGGTYGACSNSVIIGRPSSTGINSVIIGRTSNGAQDCVSIGNASNVAGVGSIAIGKSASSSTFTNSVAIGISSLCTANNQMRVGSTSTKIRLNVTGDTVLESTTSSTSPSVGGLVTSCGVGIGENLNVAGNTDIAGTCRVGNLFTQYATGISSITKTFTQSSIASTTTVDTITPGSNFGKILYDIIISDGTNTRASHVEVLYNSTATTFTETNIMDLTGVIPGSPINVTTSGSDIILQLVVTSGTYSIKYRRVQIS